MTSDIDDDIRRVVSQIIGCAPSIGPDPLIAAADEQSRRRPTMVLVAAALIAVVGVIGLYAVASRDGLSHTNDQPPATPPTVASRPSLPAMPVTFGRLTDAEIAAATVTQGTGERIPGGWYTSPDLAQGGSAIAVRLEGRTGQSGFGGPFTAHAIALDDAATRWLDVLTVATSDVDDVTQRLNDRGRGSVRRTIPEPDGVTVLIWSDDEVDEATVNAAVAGLTTTDPQPDQTISLDAPRSFHAAASYSFVGTPGVVALVTSVVTATDGTRLRVERDDLGDVYATLLDEDIDAVEAGPHASEPTHVPSAGEVIERLTTVPTEVTALTVVLEDGATLDLALADLGPFANAKVAIAPPTNAGRRIVSVDATTGG